VTLQELNGLGVQYRKVDLATFEDALKQFCVENQYKNQDEVCLRRVMRLWASMNVRAFPRAHKASQVNISRTTIPNFDERMKIFFTE
jgi:hypothetical protein